MHFFIFQRNNSFTPVPHISNTVRLNNRETEYLMLSSKYSRTEKKMCNIFTLEGTEPLMGNSRNFFKKSL
jgi:hypothetical protein